MSEYEGQPLKDMNPFSNNRPKLTASERIRNKRDAAIYEALISAGVQAESFSG